jgi:hypothetical protein
MKATPTDRLEEAPKVALSAEGDHALGMELHRPDGPAPVAKRHDHFRLPRVTAPARHDEALGQGGRLHRPAVVAPDGAPLRDRAHHFVLGVDPDEARGVTVKGTGKLNEFAAEELRQRLVPKADTQNGQGVLYGVADRFPCAGIFGWDPRPGREDESVVASERFHTQLLFGDHLEGQLRQSAKDLDDIVDEGVSMIYD